MHTPNPEATHHTPVAGTATRRFRLLAVAALSMSLPLALLACGDRANDPSQPGDRVLRGVTVINPGAGRIVDATVTIRDGKILSIEQGAGKGRGRGGLAAGGDAGGLGSGSSDEREPGAFVLPGLIDMHVHHPYASLPGHTELFARLFLAHGVTTVRDTGNFDDSIFATRDRILANEFPGPRIFACGTIIDAEIPGVYRPFWPNSLIVTDADSARRAVETIGRAGATCAKVYNGLSSPLLTAVREAADRAGIPVVGHVPFTVPFEEARIADVQHLTGALPPGSSSPRSLDESILFFANAWIDLSPDRIAFVAESSRDLGMAHTPTLVLWLRLGKQSDYEAQANEVSSHLLPRLYRDLFWNPANPSYSYPGVRPSTYARLSEAVTRMRDAVRSLHDTGVRIQAGSDTLNPFVMPGASLHEELAQLVASGLSPEEALAAATRVPGDLLGDSNLGRIEEGSPADLIVLRDDPTVDISALASIETVVARGTAYSRNELLAAAARIRDEIDLQPSAATAVRPAHGAGHCP